MIPVLVNIHYLQIFAQLYRITVVKLEWSDRMVEINEIAVQPLLNGVESPCVGQWAMIGPRRVTHH